MVGASILYQNFLLHLQSKSLRLKIDSSYETDNYDDETRITHMILA